MELQNDMIVKGWTGEGFIVYEDTGACLWVFNSEGTLIDVIVADDNESLKEMRALLDEGESPNGWENGSGQTITI